jgi:Na+-transporting NADH:ubiquinone oxidoreductase subunit E
MGVPLNPFVIMVAAALTSNMVLSNFLGMCSFISVSKDIKTANGLGMAVTFVLTLTSVLNHLFITTFWCRWSWFTCGT